MQPCELMAAKIGVDLNIFTILVNSDTPLSTEELSKETGADKHLLGKSKIVLCRPFME
jgi:hypothetical protein